MICSFCNSAGCGGYCVNYCPICDKQIDDNEKLCSSIDCKNEYDVTERQLDDYIAHQEWLEELSEQKMIREEEANGFSDEEGEI